MDPGFDRTEGQVLFLGDRLVGFSKYVTKDDDPACIFLQRSDRLLDDLSELFFLYQLCLLYTSPSPRDGLLARMPSSA